MVSVTKMVLAPRMREATRLFAFQQMQSVAQLSSGQQDALLLATEAALGPSKEGPAQGEAPVQPETALMEAAPQKAPADEYMCEGGGGEQGMDEVQSDLLNDAVAQPEEETKDAAPSPRSGRAPSSVGGQPYERGVVHGAATAALHDVMAAAQERYIDGALRPSGRVSQVVYDAATTVGRVRCADSATQWLVQQAGNRLPPSVFPAQVRWMAPIAGGVIYMLARALFHPYGGVAQRNRVDTIFLTDSCVVCMEPIGGVHEALVCDPCGHACCCRREACRAQTTPAQRRGGCFMCRRPVAGVFEL
eukprot:TRINITY_DN71185_c0_g1_i1.p1 TRINITY_DN71185_c0_g1~~TRINITY_DN71185_c0_g1_i1.p1  ORF type:complete len:331 (+),score=101.83 TRINITY_DN71185_c0_g1_i1:83-994(+)